MAFIAEDRVRDTSTTTGTGTITVSGTAPTRYRTFDDVVATSDTFTYAIIHQTANEWEVGIGTKSAADQFTRTTVISSNLGEGGTPVNFSAGTKDVILVYPPITTTAQYLANTVGKVLTTDQINASGALLALSDAATIAWDMSLGYNASVTIADNRTLGNPTNPIVGRTGMLVVTQGATPPEYARLRYELGSRGRFVSGALDRASAKDIIFYVVQSSTSIIITGSLLAVA